MSDNKKIFYKKIKNYFPWLILSLALFFTHSQHLVDSDEGIILNAAWNIINHKKLYLDSFEFIAPGAPYLLAWWWKLTEVSYLMAGFLAYLVSLSSVIGLYLISKKLNIKHWRFLAPSLFIVLSSFWPLITHNNFNVAAIIWSVYFFLLGLNKKIYFLFFAGLSSSLAILFTQHKGLVAAFVLTVYLLFLTIKQKISLTKLVVFIGGLILPLILILLIWPGSLLYKNLIIFPLLNYPLTNFVPLKLWTLCLAIISSITISVWPGLKHEIKTNFILLTLLSFSLLFTSLSRADAEHVFQTLIIFLPVLALMMEIYFPKINDRPFFYSLISLAILARFIWPPFDNLGARNIIKVIKDNCPKELNLYAGPFMPGIYFEMRTLNLTPYGFLITKQQTEAQFNKALNIIKKNPPNCVVLSYGVVEKFSYKKNNPLDNFLKENYKKVDNLGKIDILIKQ